MPVSDFIRALPKAELHLHLEGSIEPCTLIELSQRHDAQPLDDDGVARLYRYDDFGGFLKALKEVTDRLCTPEDYELITYRLIERLAEQNAIHAEVICSVGVCLWRSMDFEKMFEGMERGRERGQRDFGVSLLWIFDAIRQFGAEPAERVLDLALKFREHSVIAYGIGGDEQKGPPELFRATYQR